MDESSISDESEEMSNEATSDLMMISSLLDDVERLISEDSEDSDFDARSELPKDRIYIYNMNDDEFELYCRYISDTSRYQRDDSPVDKIKYELVYGRDDFNTKMSKSVETDESRDARNKTKRTNDSSYSVFSTTAEGKVFAQHSMNIHWNSEYAPYYFQRFVARWLAEETEVEGAYPSDLSQFKDVSGILFNNLILENGVCTET